MNRKTYLKKVHDELIVTAISSGDETLIKQAGLWDMLGLDSAAAYIKDKSKKILQGVSGPISPEEELDFLANALITGTLFKAHPVIGLGYAVAKELGVDVSGMVISVIKAVKDSLKNGKTLSESEFDSIVKSASSKDNLVKKAKSDIPFLPEKGAPLLKRLFGGLGQRRGKMLAKGIVVLALKTALLGAGLLTATTLATETVRGLASGDKKPEQLEPPSSHNEHSHKPSSKEEPKPSSSHTHSNQKSSKLRPSGRGTKKFKNDDNNMWMVPLVNNNLEDTVLTWTEEIYPQLSGYDHIIMSSPKFQSTLSMLREGESNEEQVLLVPRGFTSRKQIVDQFAHDVAKDIL